MQTLFLYTRYLNYKLILYVYYRYLGGTQIYAFTDNCTTQRFPIVNSFCTPSNSSTINITQ